MRIPSTSNTRASGGPQGTPGGRAAGPIGNAPRGMGRGQLHVGDEVYLWILLAVELVITGYFRNTFRQHHGG